MLFMVSLVKATIAAPCKAAPLSPVLMTLGRVCTVARETFGALGIGWIRCAQPVPPYSVQLQQVVVSFLSAALCISWLYAVLSIAAVQLRLLSFPANTDLANDQPFVFDGPRGSRGRDVGFLFNNSLKHLLVLIALVTDQTNIQWRILHHCTALASFYALHVGCAEVDRLDLWQCL